MDLIVFYLIENGFAETRSNAIKIIESMSDEWMDSIFEAYAYKGGEPLPAEDQKALENIRKSLYGSRSPIQPTGTGYKKAKKRTTDLSKVQIKESRREDREGLPPTGKERARQKQNPRKRTTSYSGGQNTHLRGTPQTRYLDQPGGIEAMPEQPGKYLKMQRDKKNRRSPYISRFD
jgi:hypothetical protein